MTILDAVIQGIIQGLTEFLPVSSSGHLAVYQIFFGGSDENGILFDIVLHIGTLIATIIAFRKKVWDLILELGRIFRDIFTGKFFKVKMNPDRRMIVMMLISLLVLVPFVPFKSLIEKAGNYPVLLGFLFIYTSILLFISDKCKKGKVDQAHITPKHALIIGAFQGVALFPGVSRSGSTICSSLFCGFKRELAVEYSFILGIPTILASCVLEIGDYIGKVSDGTAGAVNVPAYLIGMVVSAVVGILSIKMVSWLVKSNKFIIFSVYTFILGIVVIIAGIVR